MPSVEILGVHPLVATAGLCEHTFRTKYGEPAGLAGESDQVLQQAWKRVREELGSIVLVEAWIRDCGGPVSLCGWEQSGSGVGNLSPDDQAAYDEVFLSDDGTTVVSDHRPPPGAKHVRLVFWLHYYDPARPIVTSDGPVWPPEMSPMPDRLSKLVQYEPVD